MKRFVIMGAGEVGRYLARSLSGSDHAVVLIDSDPAKQRMIEEHLDVSFVLGSGTHVPTLEAAGIARCGPASRSWPSSTRDSGGARAAWASREAKPAVYHRAP